MQIKLLMFLILILLRLSFCTQNDARPYIALSTFGFYTNGHLNVKLSNLFISEETGDELV